MQEQRPSVAVIGAGAIGSSVAAGLIQVGHRPLIASRTPFARLEVTWPGGEVSEPVDVATEPSAVTPHDVVLLAVKAHQSASAKPWLDALVGPDTVVAVLQNGVEHRQRLAGLVESNAAILPVIVNLPAKRTAPGQVTVGGTARLTLEAGVDGERVAALFDDSFVSARAVEDWKTPAWRKLMLNAASGGVCTLARTTNLIFEDEQARALAIDIMAEVAAVGRAEGADLPEDTPERVIDGLLQAASGHMASIVVDRINGVETEWDARNAVVGRLGAKHGIETPLNEMIATLIRLGEPSNQA